MACGVGVKILNGIEAKRNRHAPVNQFASVIKQEMNEGRWSPGVTDNVDAYSDSTLMLSDKSSKCMFEGYSNTLLFLVPHLP
jgi:ribosomal protein S2